MDFTSFHKVFLGEKNNTEQARCLFRLQFLRAGTSKHLGMVFSDHLERSLGCPEGTFSPPFISIGPTFVGSKVNNSGRKVCVDRLVLLQYFFSVPREQKKRQGEIGEQSEQMLFIYTRGRDRTG